MTATMVTIGRFASNGAEHYERYAQGALPLLQRAGVRVRERLKGVEALVGQDHPDLVAILEFEDEAAMRRFLASSDYQALVPHRARAFRELRTFACETLA